MGSGPNTRRNTTIATTVFYLVSIPFLILVCIGNIYIDSTLNRMYFFKLDVANIIPISVDDSYLLNSVARSLGLHDFYQIGIWNFCEGYNDEGVTYCSTPKQFYWFNPVEVLVNELLAGAQIALPSDVVTILELLRIGSQVMYGCFLAAAVLNTILFFTSWLAIRSRWYTLGLSALAALALIVVNVSCIIATVISVAAKIALTAVDEINIRCDIGIEMFAFMWIAAVCTDVAFILHSAMGCCCRPVKRDRSHHDQSSSVSEKEKRTSTKMELPTFKRFVRRRKSPTSTLVGTS